jgi:SAM-dependent methyltransferase
MDKNSCTACGSANTTFVFPRHELITMQNYVYRDQDAARNALTGEFELRVCDDCGVAFNSTFDPSRLSYDENYNNAVPSGIFDQYYEQIATMLFERYSLDNKVVVDVGCGKGRFLKALCRNFPSVRGIGIDPSYEPDGDSVSNNPKFIQDVFKEEHVQDPPDLVICRHVLEHIQSPVSFLESIRLSGLVKARTPFFLEVPDLNWILQNQAFWDFCYEHCNYFTEDSFASALGRAGFAVEFTQTAFGQQYLWAFGTIEGETQTVSSPLPDLVDDLATYAREEADLIQVSKERLASLKSNGDVLVVWGMSTKGVVLCNLIDPEKLLFDYCIDINPEKSGAYVPHTGHQINSTKVLKDLGVSKAVVVVMNPNYLEEISSTCEGMGLQARFVSAAGEDLVLAEVAR